MFIFRVTSFKLDHESNLSFEDYCCKLMGPKWVDKFYRKPYITKFPDNVTTERARMDYLKGFYERTLKRSKN